MKIRLFFLVVTIIATIMLVYFIKYNKKTNLVTDQNLKEVLTEVIVINTPILTETPTIIEPIVEYTTGSIIVFGGSNWLILDIIDNLAKIISVDIIEKREYHSADTPITWASSNIRRYLNNDFYSSFSDDERACIVETTLINENNHWYGTNAGVNTQDKIFLLSVSEVVRYFGDSTQLSERPRNAQIIKDEYNEKRIAEYNGVASWWWLRSPGSFSFRATRVDNNGNIDMSSNHIYDAEGGLRPAMWINLET